MEKNSTMICLKKETCTKIISKKKITVRSKK